MEVGRGGTDALRGCAGFYVPESGTMRFPTELVCMFRPKFRVRDGTTHASM